MTERFRFRNGVTPARQSQSGAALFVGLVLLLVMTVLGVSGMSTSTLELVMAGNAQAQQRAFQAAETGIDIAIAQTVFTTTEPWDRTFSVGEDSVMVCRTFEQASGVPDAAFSLGVGIPSVEAYHFEIEARGTGPRGARSTHVQSFYVLGPGGGAPEAGERCPWQE